MSHPPALQRDFDRARGSLAFMIALHKHDPDFFNFITQKIVQTPNQFHFEKLQLLMLKDKMKLFVEGTTAPLLDDMRNDKAVRENLNDLSNCFATIAYESSFEKKPIEQHHLDAIERCQNSLRSLAERIWLSGSNVLTQQYDILQKEHSPIARIMELS